MAPINLSTRLKKTSSDIRPFWKSTNPGKLKTENLEGQDHLLDKTTDVARHLENIIRELKALLRDG